MKITKTDGKEVAIFLFLVSLISGLALLALGVGWI